MVDNYHRIFLFFDLANGTKGGSLRLIQARLRLLEFKSRLGSLPDFGAAYRVSLIIERRGIAS